MRCTIVSNSFYSHFALHSHLIHLFGCDYYVFSSASFVFISTSRCLSSSLYGTWSQIITHAISVALIRIYKSTHTHTHRLFHSFSISFSLCLQLFRSRSHCHFLNDCKLVLLSWMPISWSDFFGHEMRMCERDMQNDLWFPKTEYICPNAKHKHLFGWFVFLFSLNLMDLWFMTNLTWKWYKKISYCCCCCAVKAYCTISHIYITICVH